MAVLAMFCLGTAVALLIGCTIDAMKQKAYWEGRGPVGLAYLAPHSQAPQRIMLDPLFYLDLGLSKNVLAYSSIVMGSDSGL